MNLFKKIQKNWNFNQSVEQNTLRFSNEKEQKQRRNKMFQKKYLPLALGIFVVVSFFLNIPLLMVPFIIGALTYGSEYVFANEAIGYCLTMKAIDSTHFVVAWTANNYSNKAVIGTISAGAISYGTIYQFNASANLYGMSLDVLDSTHFVIAYVINNSTYRPNAIIGTIANGNEISYGTPVEVSAGVSNNIDNLSVCALDSTHFVVGFQQDNSVHHGQCKVGVVTSGNTITMGSVYEFSTGLCFWIRIAALDSTHFVIAYDVDNSTYHGQSKIGVVSNGNEIAYGSEVEFNAGTTVSMVPFGLDATHFVITYRNNSASSAATAIVGTVASGNVITYGTAVVADAGIASQYNWGAKITSTKFVIVYNNQANGYGRSCIGNVASGNVITFDTAVQFNAGGTYPIINVSATTANQIVVAYSDGGNSSKGTAIIGSITSAPTVTTQAVSSITARTATGNGNVTSDGGDTVTERGIVWKISTGPTTSDSKATASGTTGAFTASMTSLTPKTLYYVRAYAINSLGTSYGNEVTFTTLDNASGAALLMALMK